MRQSNIQNRFICQAVSEKLAERGKITGAVPFFINEKHIIFAVYHWQTAKKVVNCEYGVKYYDF